MGCQQPAEILSSKYQLLAWVSKSAHSARVSTWHGISDLGRDSAAPKHPHITHGFEVREATVGEGSDAFLPLRVESW